MKRLWFLLVLLFVLSGCRAVVYRAEQTRTLMGTDVTVTAIHEDVGIAREAVRSAFEAMQDVDAVMSSFDNTSQLWRLNQDKFLVNPDSDLVFVINRSLYYSAISNGAFDVTVQPVLDLYKQTFEFENRPPTDEEINNVLRSISYEAVVIENNSISIGENMSITLGGIAKGFAVDKAIEAMEDKGVSRGLVNAGGDVRAIGMKGPEQPWVVGLQNPRNASDYITLIELYLQSVATSGDYERYFDENKSFHHIINPRTGKSATELISVTVVGPQAIDSDALATTVFVLGPAEGLELVEQLEGVEALLITKDRKIVRSSGFIY